MTCQILRLVVLYSESTGLRWGQGGGGIVVSREEPSSPGGAGSLQAPCASTHRVNSKSLWFWRTPCLAPAVSLIGVGVDMVEAAAQGLAEWSGGGGAAEAVDRRVFLPSRY